MYLPNDVSKYTTEWARKNKDKVKVNNQKYLSQPNKKEANRLYKQKWHLDNRERRKQVLTEKTKEPIEHIRVAIKNRSRKFEVSVEAEDLYIPEYCPLLPSIKLTWGKGIKMRESAATLDKIIPSLGYTKGNVQIISYRANRIKNDATLEELIQIGDWAKNVLTK